MVPYYYLKRLISDLFRKEENDDDSDDEDFPFQHLLKDRSHL